MLIIILIFSLLSIAVFAWYTKYLGFQRNQLITSTEFATQVFLQDYKFSFLSDNKITHTSICNDDASALLYFKSTEQVGLLHSHGNRWFRYLIDKSKLRSIKNIDNRLELRFNDYANPFRSLKFEDTEICQHWFRIFTNMEINS